MCFTDLCHTYMVVSLYSLLVRLCAQSCVLMTTLAPCRHSPPFPSLSPCNSHSLLFTVDTLCFLLTLHLYLHHHPHALGMAGQFALAVNAKKLVLTHFSQRYKVALTSPNSCGAMPIEFINAFSFKCDDEQTMKKMLDQCKEAFKSDRVVCAYDFLQLDIPLSGR